MELRNLAFISCFFLMSVNFNLLLFYLSISWFSLVFFFNFFLSLFYFVLHEETITYLGMGNQGQIFLRKKKSMGYIFFLGWKIRMGRRLSFKGIYGFGKIGGNLQGRSTRNHHWKVLREGLKMDNTYSPWEKKVIQQHVKEGSPAF